MGLSRIVKFPVGEQAVKYAVSERGFSLGSVVEENAPPWTCFTVIYPGRCSPVIRLFNVLSKSVITYV